MHPAGEVHTLLAIAAPVVGGTVATCGTVQRL